MTLAAETAFVGALCLAGRPVASCFQISPGVVVSVAHAVSDDAEPPGAWSVSTLDDAPMSYPAQLVELAADRDVAVFEIDGALPGSASLLPSEFVEPGAVWRTIGHGVLPDTAVYEYHQADGRYTGPILQDRRPVLQLESDSILRGMSGGPLVVPGTRAVYGMIRGRYVPARGEPSGRRAWGVRAESIRDVAGPRCRTIDLAELIDGARRDLPPGSVALPLPGDRVPTLESVVSRLGMLAPTEAGRDRRVDDARVQLCGGRDVQAYLILTEVVRDLSDIIRAGGGGARLTGDGMQALRTVVAARQKARIARLDVALERFRKAVDAVVDEELAALAAEVPPVVESLTPRVPVPRLARPRDMKLLVGDISERAALELFGRLNQRITDSTRVELEAMMATLRRLPDHLGTDELAEVVSFPAELVTVRLTDAEVDALRAEEERAVRTSLTELDRAIVEFGDWEMLKTYGLQALVVQIVAIVVRAVLRHPLSSWSRAHRVVAVKRHVAHSLEENLADPRTRRALHDVVARYLAETSETYVWPLRDRLAVTTDDRLLREMVDGEWSAEVVLAEAVQELDRVARPLGTDGEAPLGVQPR